jgi:hypothetical protein
MACAVAARLLRQDLIVIGVINPEPDEPFLAIAGQRAIVQTDSSRPELTDFAKSQ